MEKNITPTKVCQVISLMGWRFVEQRDGLYIFNYGFDSEMKGPMFIDLSFIGKDCPENDIKKPLERHGLDYSVFVQLIDTVEG
jgi:hypothetical protein